MHTNEIDTVPRDLYLQVLNLIIDAEIWIRSMDLDSSKGIKEAKIFRRRALNETRPFFLPLVSACESKENYFGLDKAPHF